MKVAIKSLLILAMGIFSSFAYAEPLMPPTEIDLKASYCAGAHSTQDMDASDRRAKALSNERDKKLLLDASAKWRSEANKIGNYLKSRIGVLDVAKIDAANSAGKADATKAIKESNECIQACTNQNEKISEVIQCQKRDCKSDCVNVHGLLTSCEENTDGPFDGPTKT